MIVAAGRHFGLVLPSGATIPTAESWADTAVAWPESDAGVFTDILTGSVVRTLEGRANAASIFEMLPVAVFIRQDGEV
jgi:maltooligosyltrehalose synthase